MMPEPGGWFRVPNSLLEKHGAKIGALGVAVYCSLAKHANQQGLCFPSRKRIASEIGVGVSSVQRAIQRLTEAGLVVVETSGGRHSNRYRLTGSQGTGSQGTGSNGAPNRFTETRLTGSQGTGKPVHPDPLTRPIEQDPLNQTQEQNPPPPTPSADSEGEEEAIQKAIQEAGKVGIAAGEARDLITAHGISKVTAAARLTREKMAEGGIRSPDQFFRSVLAKADKRLEKTPNGWRTPRQAEAERRDAEEKRQMFEQRRKNEEIKAEQDKRPRPRLRQQAPPQSAAAIVAEVVSAFGPAAEAQQTQQSPPGSNQAPTIQRG